MDSVEKRLVAIERLLRDLLKEQKVPKETWVKATTIREITGWNNEAMRRARDNKFVKYKREGGGFWYSLESLPEVFIKNKVTPS